MAAVSQLALGLGFGRNSKRIARIVNAKGVEDEDTDGPAFHAKFLRVLESSSVNKR